ncbi:MAG: ornithine carbamoyltransferase [Acidimicrobiales bacterium]
MSVDPFASEGANTNGERVRHLLEVDDLSGEELAEVVELAGLECPPLILAGSTVALLFEKPSLRTRVSMEAAVVQLGGHPISLRSEEVGLGRREPAADVARVLAGYSRMIGARVFDHDTVAELAEASSIPVINLLSDLAHPCQVLADLITIRRHLGGWDGRVLAYLGDGNNVCRSLMAAASLTGLVVRVATPDGYGPLASGASVPDGVELFVDPHQAVAGADVVYTDVWTSMGQESEAQQRGVDFMAFSVDSAMLSRAAPSAVFMHCLPAHRGDEVTASVIDGAQSVVWEQAANRLVAQRGLLLWLAGVRM